MSFITLLLVVLIQLYCIKHHRSWVDVIFAKVVGFVLPKVSFLEEYHKYLALLALVLPVVVVMALAIAFVDFIAGPGGWALLAFLVAFSVMNVYVLSCEKSDTPRIFLLAERQIFALMFWFCVLGIQGLLAMAFIEYVARESVFNEHPHVQEAAEQLQGWLAWIPQRLMGLSFALVGHFTLAMKDLKETLSESWQHSRNFSEKVGAAALYEDKSPAACQRLITHAIWVWLGVIALVSLFSIY
jgi:AmpE protein